MHTDELRRELTALADEIEPLTADVGALHRRQRRARALTVATVIVVLGAGAATAVAVAGRDDAAKVNVSNTPTKEVAASEMTRMDAIVVPGSQAVRAALEASPAVGRFAHLPQAARGGKSDSLMIPAELNAAVCALESSDGFLVQSATPFAQIAVPLQTLLGTRAHVYAVSNLADVEIFMKVNAPLAAIDAIRQALSTDPKVAAVQFLDKNDAYAEFKKDFADQPRLVEDTKPSDLPVSFRVVVVPGSRISALVQHYRVLPYVDVAITGLSPELFDPPPNAGSACSPKS